MSAGVPRVIPTLLTSPVSFYVSRGLGEIRDLKILKVCFLQRK